MADNDSVSLEALTKSITSLALGHACTMLCVYCANSIDVSQERNNWYHVDVLGRRLGHECVASRIRNADEDQIAGLICKQLGLGS